MLSADNLCTQFGPRSGPKLLDTLMLFLKQYFEKVLLKNICRRQNIMENCPAYKELNERKIWERSGSVVECLTRDRRVTGWASPAALHCVLEQDIMINPCLVLVQPRKTSSNMTEKMLTGTQRIKSNQTNKWKISSDISFYYNLLPLQIFSNITRPCKPGVPNLLVSWQSAVV